MAVRAPFCAQASGKHLRWVLRHSHRSAQRGFTLIELLMALAIMALLSYMAWRGLEGMSRTERLTSQRGDDLLALQAGLGQWAADLQALQETGEVPALSFDGRTLRLTRRDPLANAQLGTGSPTNSPGLQVVAWAVNQGQWQRWHMGGLSTREALGQAWAQAEQWGQRPGTGDALRQITVARADSWQLFYYRGDAWTNPLSSDAATAASLAGATAGAGVTSAQFGVQSLATARVLARLPDGVRLVLALSPGQTLSGDLVRDWARPTLGGGKS